MHFFLSPITIEIFKSHFKESHLNQIDFKLTGRFLDWSLIIKLAESNKRKKIVLGCFTNVKMYLLKIHLNWNCFNSCSFQSCFKHSGRCDSEETRKKRRKTSHLSLRPLTVRMASRKIFSKNFRVPSHISTANFKGTINATRVPGH